MPLPVVTNGYYWQMRGSLHGSEFAECTGALVQTGTDAFEVANLVLSAWNTNYIPHMSQDWANIGCLVTKLDGLSAGVDQPDNTAGGDGNAAAPNQCCILISWKTGLAGRSRRGRMYLPAVGANQVASDRSQWVNAKVNGVETDTENFLSDLGTAGAIPGVLSRTLGAITPITTFVVRTKIATQRRRLNGGL